MTIKARHLVLLSPSYGCRAAYIEGWGTGLKATQHKLQGGKGGCAGLLVPAAEKPAVSRMPLGGVERWALLHQRRHAIKLGLVQAGRPVRMSGAGDIMSGDSMR